MFGKTGGPVFGFSLIQYRQWNAEPIDKRAGCQPKEVYKGRDDFLAVFDNEDTILALCRHGATVKGTSTWVIVTVGREVDLFPGFLLLSQVSPKIQ